MARLEDAVVDAAAEVLDERAEQPAVGHADGLVAIEQHFHGTHALRSGSAESGSYDRHQAACPWLTAEAALAGAIWPTGGRSGEWRLD
jgi:hypothetical protein